MKTAFPPKPETRRRVTAANAASSGERLPCATEPVLRRRDPELGTAWDQMWPRAPTEGATTLRTAAPDRKGKASQAGRYLAGALEVGGVGLDELVRVDILHRPRRRSRHPAGAGGAAVRLG